MTDLEDLPNDQLNELLTKFLGEDDQYFVMKRGQFYRHKAAGYTADPVKAWRIPLAQAEAHKSRPDEPEPVTIQKCSPLPYCSDLNAVALAEARLTDHGWDPYAQGVLSLTAGQWHSGVAIRRALLGATARIRVVALVTACRSWGADRIFIPPPHDDPNR